MLCNNKPALKEPPTRGGSRRFVDIPFDALFVNENELEEKLEEQKQGININKTYHIGNDLLPYAVKYHQSNYNIDKCIHDVI
jgi:hypothetical protein